MSLVLGLDVGTQGTKGLVLDVDAGRVIARASAAYDLLPGLPSGAAEQHPATWVEAVGDVARELLSQSGVDPARFSGVGVAGQQHGLVVLDEGGKVLRPAKLWCDTSTSDEATELSETFGHAVPTGFTASKILWLARHKPETWARTRTVLLPHDYLNFVLTGTRCMEAGDASGTGFFDSRARAFHSQEVRDIDPRLGELLPPLLAAGAPAGRLDGRGAGLLGLPAGTLVSAGGGDNMLSAVGSGATRPGVVVVSLGTSGTVFTYSDRPVIDPEGLIAPFCGSVGGWLPLLCVMNLTGVSQEVCEGFGADHSRLTAAARAVPVGCDGLLWLPYLVGERVPDLPRASGTLLGVRAGHLRGGVLYRAALEGTSLNLGWGVERMRALGIEVKEVNLVGGAAANPLWREILADVLACPVACLAEAESGALGAALQAFWTVRREAGEDVTADEVAAPFIARAGEPTLPDAQRTQAYAELGARFRQAVGERHGV
ncbi:MAG: xylulokinase [Planctomycetota bacterium]